MSKAQILFVCSEEFKEALAQYAHDNKESASEVIRQAVAAKIGYDISKEVVLDKRRKYASNEERKEAARLQQKKSRNAVAQLVAIFDQEQRREDVKALADSLRAKGISLDD